MDLLAQNLVSSPSDRIFLFDFLSIVLFFIFPFAPLLAVPASQSQPPFYIYIIIHLPIRQLTLREEILTELLNDGGKLLSPTSTDLLFTNQLDLSSPAFADFSRTLIPAAKPHLTNPIPELYPQPHDQPQGWSFAGLNVIHPGPAGRGKESVQWAGLANLFWWVDREKGVAGMIASQVLPFGGECGIFFDSEGGGLDRIDLRR